MTKTQVWDHASLVHFFKILTEKVGPWSFKGWGTKFRPISRNVNDFQKVLDDIYSIMAANNFRAFSGTRNPSRKGALKQQLEWCITTQKCTITDINRGVAQRQKRHAAWEAGFLTMSDIIFLEHAV